MQSRHFRSAAILLGVVWVLGLLSGPANASILAPSYPDPAYQWHTFFGGDPNQAATLPATAVDADGNLYVTGTTQYPWDANGNPGGPTFQYAHEAYLTKVSPTGQLLWSQFYKGIDPYGRSWIQGELRPVAITLDSSRNIYIAGAGKIEDDGTNFSSFVMEVDPSGNKIWGANFGGQNYLQTTVYGLTYDPVQNWVYVTGMAAGSWNGGQPLSGGLGLPTNGASAMFILQVGNATQGEGLGWYGFYYTPDAQGGGTDAYGAAITVDASSNLIVAGQENGNQLNGGDVAVWKVSSTGQQAWELIYGWGFSYAVALHGSNVYVTGYSGLGWNGPTGQPPLNAFAYGDSRVAGAVAFVLKLDTDGNYAWHTFYHGNTEQSIGEGIAVDGPTTVYVAGPGDLVGYNNAAPQHDTGGGGHFILKLDDSGTYQWHSLYGVYRWDEASSIAVDPQHDVYVSGWSGYNTWNGDNNTPPLHDTNLAASSVFVMKFSVFQLEMAVVNAGDNAIKCGTWDVAGNFSGLSRIGGKSTEAPAVAVFMDREYMAVKGASNNNIYLRYQDSTGTWTSWGTISGGTIKSPALAAFNNRLYLVVKGASNNKLHLRSMDALGNWDPSWTTLSGQTTEAPALTVFNNRLYLFVKGATSNSIYYKSMDTTGAWNSWLTVPTGTTTKSLSIAAFNNNLYVFAKGATNNNIYYRSMDTSGVWDGVSIVSGQTTEAPSVTVLGDRLYVAVKGATNTNAYIRSMDVSGTWTSWTMVPANTSTTPVLSTFYYNP